MNFAEFARAVRSVAGDKYCAVTVEATMNSCGKPDAVVIYKAYIDGRSWTEGHRSPKFCVEELAGKTGDDALDAVGEESP